MKQYRSLPLVLFLALVVGFTLSISVFAAVDFSHAYPLFTFDERAQARDIAIGAVAFMALYIAAFQKCG